MCYTIVCCEGEENVRDAQGILDVFVGVMENAHKVDEKTGLMELVRGL